ncbi:hypothetical protein SAMN04488132_102327 [Sediminibacterium ginsengisoli]|uniref:Uncharacterized protein n=1 Tax=Sediminibacterium ginsengisoli TaxID=413434 RepID=A0A1T4L6D7_9BACT|nr:hypothetical protein SAMN04488132_102327 [Sediminibacterium ginsengisoli]
MRGWCHPNNTVVIFEDNMLELNMSLYYADNIRCTQALYRCLGKQLPVTLSSYCT